MYGVSCCLSACLLVLRMCSTSYLLLLAVCTACCMYSVPCTMYPMPCTRCAVATAAELKWLVSPPARLVSAAMDDDLTTAKHLLRGQRESQGLGLGQVDVNAVDPQDNLTPLLAATSQGHEDMVRLLLAQSALDVNQAVVTSSRSGVPGNGVTALMEASMQGNEVLVELLLASGAQVDTHTAEGYGGMTALWLASSQGHAGVVGLLLKGADKGADEGEGVGEADPSLARLADGITPLMAAAGGGHAGVVRQLLEAGAAVNARDSDGVTAVLNVAESGDLETLLLLLAADGGAEVNYMSNNHFSPLIVACAHGHYEVIAALLDAGDGFDNTLAPWHTC